MNAFQRLARFVSDEGGQDLIEYTLLMAFIALASASIFLNAGGSVSAIWGKAGAALGPCMDHGDPCGPGSPGYIP